MTKRINQKLAAKRKLEGDKEAVKEIKKTKKVKLTAVKDDEQIKSTTSSLLVDRLKGDSDEAMQALAQLAKCTGKKNNEEVVQDDIDEFFAGGGTASHLLHVMDTNPVKNKANDVAAVFNALEAVVLRIVSSGKEDGPGIVRGTELGVDLVRRVTTDYCKELVLLLSGTNSTYQAKSVLRLLTSMVTMGGTSARELLAKLNWDHDNWDTLPKRTSRQDLPDVRTCYIHFLLAFLFETSPLVLKDFFSKKTKLSSVLGGLVHDPVDTVLLVLETLKTRVLLNPVVSKTNKMKLFGAHHIKTLLSLLNWKGHKKDEDANIEDKELIKESVTEFIGVLCGSPKHGIIFQDPEFGLGEKDANPLLKELLLGLSRPWDELELAELVVKLVSNCPGQFLNLLKLGQDSWSDVRDTESWHKVTDLLLAVIEGLDPVLMSSTVRPSSSIVKGVLNKIVLPSKLTSALTEGLKGHGEAVTGKCLEMLVQMADNSHKFLENISGGESIRVARSSITDALGFNFPAILCLLEVWRESVEKGRVDTCLNSLKLINFKLAHTRVTEDLDVDAILGDIEKNTDKLGNMIDDVQLEGLKMFQSVTRDNSNLQFLRSLCTERIFTLLIKNIVIIKDDESGGKSSSGDRLKRKMLAKRETSKWILESLVRGTEICLKSVEDLDLILALLQNNPEHLGKVACILDMTVKNKKLYQDQIDSYELAQLSLSSNKVDASIDELFEALLETDFDEKKVDAFVPESKSDTYFSPFIVALLKNHLECPQLVELYFFKLLFLFEDVMLLSNVLKQHIEGYSFNFKNFVDEPLCSSSHLESESGKFNSWILLKAEACRLVHLSKLEANLGDKLLELLKAETFDKMSHLVRFLVSRRFVIDNFFPYKADSFSQLVLQMLSRAGTEKVQCSELKDKFLMEMKTIVEDKPGDKLCTKMVTDSFHLFNFSFNELHTLFSDILKRPVKDFLVQGHDQLNILGEILSGSCRALSQLDKHFDDPRLVPLLKRIGCLLEVLFDSCQGLSFFADSLCVIMEAKNSLCEDSVSENLVLVCLKDQTDQEQSKAFIRLAGILVWHSKKQLEAFKFWVVEDKYRLSKRLWPLIPKLFENQEFKNEKKFVTILLKNVVDEVKEAFLNKEEDGDNALLLEIVTQLCKVTKSDKQLELWLKALGEKIEQIGDCLEISENLLIAKTRILITVQKSSGGQDLRIMKETFLPLLNHIGLNLRSTNKDKSEKGISVVVGLCTAANEVKDLIDNKSFIKEITKNSDLWEKFYRQVLKYSLKLGDAADGVAALNLLSSICVFLMAGGKLSVSESLVEMTLSHSQYLTVLLGPSSNLKTSLVEFLFSLLPVSCRLEQVPVLLSAYSATLHPSDKAILSLLFQYEANGFQLSQYQPFMFGQPAISHYSLKSSSGSEPDSIGWKALKASDLLGLLDLDKMRQTSLKFPMGITLDPSEEIADDLSLTDSSEIYDPRFLLSFLSNLLDPASEIYMDKHMRLIDSGALGFAIAATSSAVYTVRSAGYHLLHGIYSSMESAKLASEKQVWLHLINLVRQGLSTSPKWSAERRCVRLPSLLTVFLVKTVDVLLNPIDSLYRPICRFLLAKPALDLQAIPEFSRLLNSSDLTNSRNEKMWMLRLIKIGVRDNIDYELVKRNFAGKILMSQWSSCLVDRVVHLHILDVLQSCVRTNYGCLDLVTKQGLLPWLTVIVKDRNSDKKIVQKICDVMDIIQETVRKYDKRKTDQQEGDQNRKVEEVIASEMKLLFKVVYEFFDVKDKDHLKSFVARFDRLSL